MNKRVSFLTKGAPALVMAVALACGGGSDSPSPSDNVPTSYTFEKSGNSTVSYTGQTARHLLIKGMYDYLDGLDDLETKSSATDLQGDAVYDRCNLLYSGASSSQTLSITDSGDSATTIKQTFYSEINSGKNLVGKIAGKDTSDDKTFDDGVSFKGWDNTGLDLSTKAGAAPTTPNELVDALMNEVNDMATIAYNGTAKNDARGESMASLPFYINEEGLDLKQLLQKFLLGAVPYSQATDDYLDEQLKKSSNELSEGDAYTTLEHKFDEGFGYFGASTHYLQFTDAEIKAGTTKDINGDTEIDLKSEYNFGHSVNAGKRDVQLADDNQDFTSTIFNALKKGRHIIHSASGDLNTTEMAELEAQVLIAVNGWEDVIVATIVHYINKTITEVDALTATSDIKNYAKYWAELKGFALGLQFNPKKQISDKEFAQLHAYIGSKPELTPANAATYKANLVLARDLIDDIYDGFTVLEP